MRRGSERFTNEYDLVSGKKCETVLTKWMNEIHGNVCAGIILNCKEIKCIKWMKGVLNVTTFLVFDKNIFGIYSEENEMERQIQKKRNAQLQWCNFGRFQTCIYRIKRIQIHL